ncbi:MAG TPA: helix-turn-helix transcriptional regulator [Thermoanaerobaculia bacterium]
MYKRMPPRTEESRTKESISFGKRVRELRTARGWTQEHLAEESGMNWLQVGHIERGASDPKLSTIIRLAKALGVKPGELLDPIKTSR